MSWRSQKKKECIFCTVYLVWRKFYVLSQCTVYWIHFQNIHTFTYQKTLLHRLFLLVLKSSKALSVSLRRKMLVIIKRLLDNKTTSFSNIPIRMLNIYLSAYSEKLTNTFRRCCFEWSHSWKKMILTRVYTCKNDINNKVNNLPANIFEWLMHGKSNQYP